MLEQKIKSSIREIPDFPKPGIIFKDITPVLKNPSLCNLMLERMAQDWSKEKIDCIAGIESRGFLFGFRLAGLFGVPFILIRKPGKLPYKRISEVYELEYGNGIIEMHQDEILPGDNILIHDDLLATGGTAEAAAKLILKQEGKIAGYSFIVALDFLHGKKKLEKYSKKILSLVNYK